MGITLKDLVLLFPNKCILIRLYSRKGMLLCLVNAKPLDIIQNDDIKNAEAIRILYNKSESHFIIEVVNGR